MELFQERADGTLLLSTSAGLVARGPTGAKLLWKSPESGQAVQAALDDEKGRIWLAVEHFGLVRLGPEGERRFDRRDGLPSEWVMSVLMDDGGNLWLGTHGGIVSVPIAELLAAGPQPVQLSIRTLTTRDGLKSNYVKSDAVRAADGSLWFGTSRGVTVVNPLHLVKSPPPRPAVIESVSVDGRPWTTLKVVAPPGRGDVDIEYTAPAPEPPDLMRFRYKLDGYDLDWQETSKRSVRYTLLPPRQYRFHVRAANADGVWSAAVATIDLTLRPRFYQTSLFRALCGLLVVGAAAGAYHLRVRQLRQRQRKLQARIDEAVGQIKTLSGLLPICAWCKRVRDDSGYWNQIEMYVRKHSEAEFSHGICPADLRISGVNRREH